MSMKFHLLSYISMALLVVCGCTSSDSRYSKPEVFFKENVIRQPTAIITIGMSGSGKSTWSLVGEKYGWKVIDSDQLNTEIIKQMRITGQIAPELGVIPDETSSYHLYALREKGIIKARTKLEEYFSMKQSFIFDSLGLNSERSKLTEKLKDRGYKIWYLVFESEDISVNRYNLFLRESIGGFASFKGLPINQRCLALNRMLNQQNLELNKVINAFKQNQFRSVDRVFFATVKDLRGSGATLDPCL